MVKLKLSNLPKTWLIDIDGTIFSHNSHLTHTKGRLDRPLDNVAEFISGIGKEDMVILLTARETRYRAYTIRQLKKNKIRFDMLIMDLPIGERIIINDIKRSGLKTAHAINIERNRWPKDLSYSTEM
jgi:hypothetical protein